MSRRSPATAAILVMFLAAVVLAAVALAGCSSSASGTSGAPPSAAAVAQRLGCTGVQPVSPPTLYAYNEVTATCHGRQADIATFRTDTLRDSWVAVAGQFAGIEQTGDRFAVADASS